MADERRGTPRHSLVMEQRERLTVQGVTDVISFDEDAVISETGMGILIVRGINLHVSKLNLESGELHIEGDIDAVMYEEEGLTKGGRTSFFSKIFK